jgi:riboflavin kinase/FMN adenylyltransferase
LIPSYGVYATNIYYDKRRFDGATNIGDNPTFGDEGTSIETFIFDFKGDLYGKNLTIEFVDMLRTEIKFESKEELVDQIDQDCIKAKTILKNHNAKLDRII